jgi:hypothetical protein
VVKPHLKARYFIFIFKIFFIIITPLKRVKLIYLFKVYINKKDYCFNFFNYLLTRALYLNSPYLYY